MNATLAALVLECTGASQLQTPESLQELWSGYGTIQRIRLKGASAPSVVVKHVQPPNRVHHPRGWHSDHGHRRKLTSYEVEMRWYSEYSTRCIARVPKCLASKAIDGELFLVLEDLDASGFPLRKTDLTWEGIQACLTWLAQFHASYLGNTPEGLWAIGTYWHLDTRPQELEALEDRALKAAASAIDARLNAARFQTFVHGDAKLANFCFSPEGEVAGVDFQYVGGGCGMKDVAYFVGSCLDEDACERLEGDILDTYFAALHAALGAEHPDLEREWRALYRVAWADFHRFLKGWSPGHWKINSYSERMVQEVLQKL
jgi:hypothetical protein